MNNLVVYEGANKILSNLCTKNDEIKQFSKVISEEGLSIKSAIRSYKYLIDIGYVEFCGAVEKLENDFYLRATQIGSAMLWKEKSEGKSIFLPASRNMPLALFSKTKHLSPRRNTRKDRMWMNMIMLAVIIILIIFLCINFWKYLTISDI